MSVERQPYYDKQPFFFLYKSSKPVLISNCDVSKQHEVLISNYFFFSQSGMRYLLMVSVRMRSIHEVFEAS